MTSEQNLTEPSTSDRNTGSELKHLETRNQDHLVLLRTGSGPT